METRRYLLIVAYLKSTNTRIVFAYSLSSLEERTSCFLLYRYSVLTKQNRKVSRKSNIYGQVCHSQTEGDQGTKPGRASVGQVHQKSIDKPHIHRARAAVRGFSRRSQSSYG